MICAHKFETNARTTLLIAPSEEDRTTALPVHAGCVTMAMHGQMEPPPHELALEHPELPPEQRQLQERYSDALTLLMIDQMKPEQSGSTIAMINALFSHAIIGLNVLNKAGVVKPGGLDRVIERLRLALRNNTGTGNDG